MQRNPINENIIPPLEIAANTPCQPLGMKPPCAVKFSGLNLKYSSPAAIISGMAILNHVSDVFVRAKNFTPTELINVKSESIQIATPIPTRDRSNCASAEVFSQGKNAAR